MIWYMKQLVRARATRATFGIRGRHRFDESKPSHQVRQSLKYVDVRGQTRIGGIFNPLVIQVCDSVFS